MARYYASCYDPQSDRYQLLREGEEARLYAASSTLWVTSSKELLATDFLTAFRYLEPDSHWLSVHVGIHRVERRSLCGRSPPLLRQDPPIDVSWLRPVNSHISHPL